MMNLNAALSVFSNSTCWTVGFLNSAFNLELVRRQGYTGKKELKNLTFSLIPLFL